MPEKILAYTDGSYFNNKGGWGYVFPHHQIRASGPVKKKPTNNRAELMAILKAMIQARKMDVFEMMIKTDSMYAVNSLSIWIPKWVKQNWKKGSTGKEVENKDILEKIWEHMQMIRILPRHVQAHGSDLIDPDTYWNEYADRLAKRGADAS